MQPATQQRRNWICMCPGLGCSLVSYALFKCSWLHKSHASFFSLSPLPLPAQPFLKNSFHHPQTLSSFHLCHPCSYPLLHPQLWWEILPGLQNDEGLPHRAHCHGIPGFRPQWAASVQWAESRQGFHLPGTGEWVCGAQVSTQAVAANSIPGQKASPPNILVSVSQLAPESSCNIVAKRMSCQPRFCPAQICSAVNSQGGLRQDGLFWPRSSPSAEWVWTACLHLQGSCRNYSTCRLELPRAGAHLNLQQATWDPRSKLNWRGRGANKQL